MNKKRILFFGRGAGFFLFIWNFAIIYLLVLFRREEELTQLRIDEHRGGMYCARDD
jgi:hypothetical protein